MLKSIPLLLVLTPAELPNLEFSGIDSQTSGINSTGIVCPGRQPTTVCKLSRTSIAEIPFDSSMVLLNAETNRVTNISITWKYIFWDTRLIEALTTKYGKSDSDVVTDHVNKTGGPYTIRYVRWRKFKNGTIYMLRGENSITLSFTFSENASEKKASKIDF